MTKNKAGSIALSAAIGAIVLIGLGTGHPGEAIGLVFGIAIFWLLPIAILVIVIRKGWRYFNPLAREARRIERELLRRAAEREIEKRDAEIRG